MINNEPDVVYRIFANLKSKWINTSFHDKFKNRFFKIKENVVKKKKKKPRKVFDINQRWISDLVFEAADCSIHY